MALSYNEKIVSTAQRNRGITSNHKEDLYYLNHFQSQSTKDKLKKHYNVCKNHDCCYGEMPNEENKILKYNMEKRP